jgi:DivIVA domain-containing protein
MLTITDVTTKRFSTARMHEGYEMTEVDRFVAEVAEALYERDERIADLRAEAAAGRRLSALDASSMNGQANGHADAIPAEPSPSVPDLDLEVELPEGAHEMSVSALRMLEIATANADQLVREAKIEAGALLTSARAAADQLTASSRDEAARVKSELEQARKNQETELQQYRSALLAELNERKAALESRIKELSKIESEHLTELHGYFTEQLAQIKVRCSAVGLTEQGPGPDGIQAVG